jgi:predicted RNase H-like HicB family nuclease
MRYTLSLEQGNDGSWWVTVLNLPGCFSWGETHEDAARNAREAIEGHLEVMHDFGDPLPAGTDGVIDVEIVRVIEAPPVRRAPAR